DALLVWPLLDTAEVEPLHVGVDFGRAGDDKRGDLDPVALEDVGREDHVGDLAAGAGADVGPVQLDVAAVVGGVAVVGAVGLGDERLQRAQVPLRLEDVLGAGVLGGYVPGGDVGAGADVGEGLV